LDQRRRRPSRCWLLLVVVGALTVAILTTASAVVAAATSNQDDVILSAGVIDRSDVPGQWRAFLTQDPAGQATGISVCKHLAAASPAARGPAACSVMSRRCSSAKSAVGAGSRPSSRS
jgi:hypothetical protein